MRLCKALPVAMILLAGSAAWAQDQETASYVVRPGDTLEGLTARYLGSQERWRENWQLNSANVEDPHKIFPGQRIRLLLPPRLPDDGALLTRIANRVEDQPTPLAWITAEGGELLRARDGIKTHETASAQLRFSDDTLMMLTEQSTVFIGEKRTREKVERRQIEIIVGQADLEGPAVASDTAEFEIVLGDARATPRAGEDAALQTRARKEESGAQLMVYSGESDLEAAGGKVTVGSGMGSSVPEGKPPAPPEKLLPAPTDLDPAPGARLATPQPSFSWSPVDGARDYTVEICRDTHCGSLVKRAQGLADASWQPPEALPVEALYWRVTAISPSGLDGYPSGSTSLEILTDVPDTTPPTVAVSFTGPQVAPRGGLNPSWILGPGMEIEVEVEDGESGVAGWTASLDGEEIAAEALKGPWEKGEHTLKVEAADQAGNSFTKEVPFVYDPDPPELTWGVEGDPGALGVIEGESDEAVEAARRDLRGRHSLRVGKVNWQLDSDLAQIRLRPQTRKPISLAGLGTLGHEQGLWVLADDEVCSDLGNLAYTLVAGSEKGEVVLWTKAVDCVGNSVIGQLPLARQKSKRK